jgi:uncharacterized membrane protein
MSVLGKFHPLLVHFPIALVLAAAGGELMVMATTRQSWRAVAVANIRAGAAMGVVAAITGWLFALPLLGDGSPSLEWHRWVGMASAAGAIAAAILSWRLHVSSRGPVFVYRFMLFATAFLVANTGHLGGALVWGGSFFQP